MSRRCYSFRPNPHDASHMAAWDVLQSVPEGQRSGFVVQAILKMRENSVLEETLRKILQEELRRGRVSQSVSTGEQQGDETPADPPIPQEMMGFLSSLMNEE